MIRQYFKQAWRLLMENPVLSTISIIGTALTICMIMVIVMSYRVKNATYPPETNRDRTLYMQYIGAQFKNDSLIPATTGSISMEFAKACLKPLKTPEAVSISSSTYEPAGLVSIPGEIKKVIHLDKRLTDAEFWQIFDFSFVCGKPYTVEDVESGLKKAVITESVALGLFEERDVAGKIIRINHVDYTVSGVVKDVSTLTFFAYAQVWLPYTSQEIYQSRLNIIGRYQAFILAKSPKDFPAIRQEAEQVRQQFNEGQTDWIAVYMEQPDKHYKAIHRFATNLPPDMKQIIKHSVITLLLLLLIPAVNLSSMTGSRMQKRLSELGIQRAFGATKSNIFTQTICESSFQTLLGGLLGLIFSFIASYAFKEVIYGNRMNARLLSDISIPWKTLFDPAIFVYTLLFCFLLNLLSAFIPAWKVSRTGIARSILSK